MSWVDQGWGNNKGRFKISLQRNGHTISTYEPFGVCPHSKTKERCNI